jgi:ABC-type transport system involved in multi-copper enzyme maturation permease subunit
MSFDSIAKQLLPCFVLTVIQFAAALPWLWAVDPNSFRRLARRPSTWGNVIGAILGITVLAAVVITYQRGASAMELAGRTYGALLHLQILVDLFIAVFAVVLFVWPKGGAVALSAFREGIRTPWFWLIGVIAVFSFFVAMIFPFFTFGDDFKMMKQMCFDVSMLAALVFGVLTASISINEEIEGRTAVTLMSKPVTRRQFLIGKFLGITLSALALTLLVGWFFNWALYIQPTFNPLDEAVDPFSLQAQHALKPMMAKVTNQETQLFMQGLTKWLGEARANGLGLILGFGKVMVLLAVASALATRMPMITNLVLCMSLFFLGHLAPVLRRVSEQLRAQSPDNRALSLVNFLTQLLETVTPAFEFFDMGPAIIRDTPVGLRAFELYVASASLYALLYTTIVLLFGLILFEDRDLA